MKALIIINVALIGMLVAVASILLGAAGGLFVLASLSLFILGGVLTAYFYYKRAKIYEKRSDIGPDA